MIKAAIPGRALTLLAAIAAADAIVAADYAFPVAGLEPAQRPAGAPVITDLNRDAAWYSQALHGISRPYPSSLRFLENQGAWHTPFNRPGMPPPYDIRAWHRN